jgi:hypothetical protein
MKGILAFDGPAVAAKCDLRPRSGEDGERGSGKKSKRA